MLWSHACGGSTGVLTVLWDRKNPMDSVRCTWVHRTDPCVHRTDPCVTRVCTLRAWGHPYDYSCMSHADPVGLVQVQYGANRSQQTCGP